MLMDSGCAKCMWAGLLLRGCLVWQICTMWGLMIIFNMMYTECRDGLIQ
jgi:hypothetical protein